MASQMQSGTRAIRRTSALAARLIAATIQNGTHCQ
jgi:hypothetical protein